MPHSGLTLPLDIGTWSCELVPLGDYRSPGGERLRFVSGDELKQIENDRRTFDRYFRPRYDFRRTIRTDIHAICSFIRHKLKVAHWNMPTDNAGIERVLKRAVSDGWLVPVVDRDRRIPVRTALAPPAPEHWGVAYRGGGGGVIASTSGKSFFQSVMESMRLDAEGATAYIERYNAMVERVDAMQAARVSSLPGLLDAAAATALGGAALLGGAGSDAGSGSLGSDDPTLLGDAQPFDYQPDAINGDTEELAARTNSPRFAAKMLGYDKDTFSDMLHVFKPENGLGPADNVIFHDDGSVEFNGQMLDDNIHNYAP